MLFAFDFGAVRFCFNLHNKDFILQIYVDKMPVWLLGVSFATRHGKTVLSSFLSDNALHIITPSRVAMPLDIRVGMIMSAAF